MTIYLVFRRLDEGADALCRVYSTEELAQAYIANCTDQDAYYIDEYELDREFK